jgi:hypothetical protein
MTTQTLPVASEPPAPDDEAHRIMRTLDLTVTGCPCRRCSNLRDMATVSLSRFGEEDEAALAAIDRINQRAAR